MSYTRINDLWGMRTPFVLPQIFVSTTDTGYIAYKKDGTTLRDSSISTLLGSVLSSGTVLLDEATFALGAGLLQLNCSGYQMFGKGKNTIFTVTTGGIELGANNLQGYDINAGDFTVLGNGNSSSVGLKRINLTESYIQNIRILNCGVGLSENQTGATAAHYSNNAYNIVARDCRIGAIFDADDLGNNNNVFFGLKTFRTSAVQSSFGIYHKAGILNIIYGGWNENVVYGLNLEYGEGFTWEGWSENVSKDVVFNTSVIGSTIRLLSTGAGGGDPLGVWAGTENYVWYRNRPYTSILGYVKAGQFGKQKFQGTSGETDLVADYFYSLNGIDAGSQYETIIRGMRIRGNGRFRRLQIDVSAVAGVGAGRTFTLRQNGGNTALTVTLDADDWGGTDDVNVVNFSNGDQICIQHTVTGAPANAKAMWALEADIDT